MNLLETQTNATEINSSDGKLDKTLKLYLEGGVLTPNELSFLYDHFPNYQLERLKSDADAELFILEAGPNNALDVDLQKLRFQLYEDKNFLRPNIQLCEALPSIAGRGLLPNEKQRLSRLPRLKYRRSLATVASKLELDIEGVDDPESLILARINQLAESMSTSQQNTTKK